MIQDAVFFLIVAMTLIGAFCAVWLKNVFYNALALILCLFGVACLFVYLDAEFLAVIEVIVYIGAISIAILFAIMLSRPMQSADESRSSGKNFKSLAIAGLLFAALAEVVRRTAWPTSSVVGDGSIRALGKALLGWAVLPFEAVSLVLLIAIIGALTLSGEKDNA